MTRTIAAIWSALLVVTTVGVVPIVVGLLQRALTAARNIDRYTGEAAASGTGIAQHTASAAKLTTTTDVAGNLLGEVEAIARHTASLDARLSDSSPAVEREAPG